MMQHTCVSLIKPTIKKKRNNLGTMIWNATNEQHFRTLKDTSTLYSVNNRILADHTL